MENLKKHFKQNEWNLITDILKNGKSNTWVYLAIKHNIRLVDTTTDQKKKAANDVWRKYQRLSTSQPKVAKVLIYDIETSKTPFELWWSGNQFVNGNNALDDSKIVTISYKWLNSDTVGVLKWNNKKKSDKKLMKEFLEVYNQADMVIGINNNRFDNKFVNTRAAKYGLDVNLHVKSLDVQKECRRLFRLPSYSMKYLGRYFEIPQQKMKVHLEDIWEDLVYGTKEASKKAMKLLIKYNIQDILTTEQLYIRLRKYLKHPVHLGILSDKEKTTCPICGGHNVELYKTTTTSSGTIQRIMQCKDDNHLFKMSNSEYLKTIKDE